MMRRQPGRTAFLEGLAAGGCAIGLAIAMTYPVSVNPGGLARLDTGDGRFSIWNVAWVARTLVVDPLHVFDANIFHPHTGTLAFSEANLGAGLLAVPAYWTTGSPYSAHNFVVVLSFVLSALGGYYLTRRLTGHRGAAAVAAVLFAYCPYIFARTAHIQLLLTAGLPFSMLALHRLVDVPSAGRALALGAILAAQALSCGYYGVFVGLMAGFSILFYAAARGAWRQPRYWIAVGLAAATAILLVAPFLIPYLRLQEAGAFMGRELSDARTFSADWRSYLASPARSHGWLLPLIGRWNDVLFPGFLAVALAAIGVWTGLRRQPPALPPPLIAGVNDAPTRETVVLYLLIAVLALWISFGPDAGLYTAAAHSVPAFRLVRAPARIGVVVALALAVLAAAGVAHLLAGRHRQNWMAAALAVLAACELAAVPLPGRPVPPGETVHRLLARQPDGPVAEFPFYYTPIMFHHHTEYMLQSTHHWKPLINGYSDHIPQDFRDAVLALSTFPSRTAFNQLRVRDARYVVVHLHEYDWRSRARVVAATDAYREFLRPLWQDDQDWLFEIVAWPDPPD